MCSDRRGAGHREDLQMSPKHGSVVAQGVSHCNLLSCTFHNPILLRGVSESFPPSALTAVTSPSCLKWKLLDKTSKNGKGYALSDLGKQVATFRELKLWFSCDWMSCTIRSGGAASAPCAALLGKQHLRDTALEDKQWPIHLTLSHHLKIYFCSFTVNVQQGTDSSHTNLETTQWKDF